MTIIKSIIITLFLIVCLYFLGLLLGLTLVNFNVGLNFLGLSEMLSTLVIYLLLFIYIKHSKKNYRHEIYEKKPKFSYNVLSIILVIAIGRYLFDVPFFEWKNVLNKYVGTDLIVVGHNQYVYNSNFISRAISAVVIAPVLEELVFRYYIFGGLLKSYSLRISVVTSSLLFALIHFDSPKNIVPAFALGIISSLIYFKTKRIDYSILFHFISNCFWLLTIIFIKQYGQLITDIGTGILFWFIFILGILLCVIGIKRIPSIVTLKNKNDVHIENI